MQKYRRNGRGDIVNKLIEQALSGLGIPCYSITRGTNNVECIVYNYTSNPGRYADNTLKGTKYIILLNIYSKTNVETTKKNVLEAMRNAGFKGGQVQNTVVENPTIGLFNTPIRFNAYIAE